MDALIKTISKVKYREEEYQTTYKMTFSHSESTEPFVALVTELNFKGLWREHVGGKQLPADPQISVSTPKNLEEQY
jgi:hypothetical protein